MRPGQIRVFDGLRVTTEHVDHFQASLHSAIHDIREIVGLGMVHAGFGVVATDAQTVTVQPGLAFDLQKNRIVSDDELVVKVPFDEQNDTAYVCAKYDQVEDGETEGRFTRIFDACTLAVRSTLPTAADNLVVLAQVTRQSNGPLVVADLRHSVSAPPEAAKEPEPPPAQPASSIRQGVMNFTAQGAVPSSVSSLLGAAAGRPGRPASGDLSAELAGVELPGEFTWSAVTCYTTLSATVTVPAREPAPSAGSDSTPSTAAAAAASPVEIAARASAVGEVTVADGVVAQFTLVSSDRGPGELFENLVFNLSLDPGETRPAPSLTDDGSQLLARIGLFARLEPSGTNALKVAIHLAWRGGWSDDTARRLDELKPTLTWTGRLAWKAVGQPTA